MLKTPASNIESDTAKVETYEELQKSLDKMLLNKAWSDMSQKEKEKVLHDLPRPHKSMCADMHEMVKKSVEGPRLVPEGATVRMSISHAISNIS